MGDVNFDKASNCLFAGAYPLRGKALGDMIYQPDQIDNAKQLIDRIALKVNEASLHLPPLSEEDENSILAAKKMVRGYLNDTGLSKSGFETILPPAMSLFNSLTNGLFSPKPQCEHISQNIQNGYVNVVGDLVGIISRTLKLTEEK